MQRSLIEQALMQRLNDSKRFDLNEICFPKQLEFIKDKSPWVTASCSRRSGKTEACAMDLLFTAINNPATNSLYITLTRSNAERIVWPKLQALNDQYKLGGTINLSKLTITFPNKSVIYLSGCNDKSELDKFRGLALKLIYIDEAQSFKSFIRELVDEVLAPALADYAGSLKFLGTPAPIPSGFFYDTINSSAYSHHYWTFFDNPFISQKAGMAHQAILDRELSRRGVSSDHPTIQREWFGKWTIDADSLVFDYNKAINDYSALPELTDYIVGIDIGFNDADAIAVIGWNRHIRACYLVSEVITRGQDITQLAGAIEQVVMQYSPLKVVIDSGGLGKKIAEELRKRFNLPIQAAEKSRKHEYIALLNDAMRTSQFRAMATSRFAADCNIVEYDFDKCTPERMVIKDEPHSDICDAVLYGFREALHWLPEPIKRQVNMRDQSMWVKHTEELMQQSLEKQIEMQEADALWQDNEAIMAGGFEESPLNYYLNKRRANGS